jgi:hypothetical protein
MMDALYIVLRQARGHAAVVHRGRQGRGFVKQYLSLTQIKPMALSKFYRMRRASDDRNNPEAGYRPAGYHQY